MLRTQIQIPSRRDTASPTSTAVSLSYVNAAKLPTIDLGLGCGSSTVLQNRPPAVTNSLYADAVRQDVAQYDGYCYDPSPSPLLLGVPQAAAGLDVIGLIHQADTVLVRVPVHPPSNFRPLPSMPIFCQEVQPAPAVNSDTSSSLPGASTRSSPSAAPPSRKMTIMCKNGPSCIWHKKNHCDYAHSPAELRRFLLSELREAKKDKDFLSYVCFDFVMNGYCPFEEKCSSLHDPNVKSHGGTKCDKCYLRATRAGKPHQIYPLRNRHVNSVPQENVLVLDALWKLREDLGRDQFVFEDTCKFIANMHKGIHDIFGSPFVIQNGTEKLSNDQKMAIAVLMHQKSPFSEAEDTTHQAHLNYTFSNSDGQYLDGKKCNVLQTRCFKVNYWSHTVTVEEVPSQPASADVVVASELVFDAKGSKNCKHSIWFDAIFAKANSKEAADKLKADATVHCVHSKPFVLMEPIDDAEEGHELIHSIMKEMIGRNGGPLSTEVRDRFIQLNNYYRDLAWTKTKEPSDESAAALKTMDGHVSSPYICQGSKVEAIWESFKTNLASVSDNKTPEGGSRLKAFCRIKAGLRKTSATLPKLPKNFDNMADFLAQYSQ